MSTAWLRGPAVESNAVCRGNDWAARSNNCPRWVAEQPGRKTRMSTDILPNDWAPLGWWDR